MSHIIPKSSQLITPRFLSYVYLLKTYFDILYDYNIFMILYEPELLTLEMTLNQKMNFQVEITRKRGIAFLCSFNC